MKKKLLKVMISVLLVASVMTAMVSVADADTTKFDVTVTNYENCPSPDPLTPRVLKSNDGDTKFYVRVLSMSGACPFVNFYIHRYLKPKKKTVSSYDYDEYLRFPRSNVTKRMTQEYNDYAPGDYYYYLECVPYSGYCNINVTGRFTP